MSAYSTLTFTETAAKNYILQEVGSMDRADLERVLDMLLDKRLYNASIVSDDTEKADYHHKIKI